MKKVVLIDMDGVLVDFGFHINKVLKKTNLPDKYRSTPDQIDGIFRDPPPIKGALDAVKKLHDSGRYNLFITTTAPWYNTSSFTDKRIWIEHHFGNLFKKNVYYSSKRYADWGLSY